MGCGGGRGGGDREDGGGGGPPPGGATGGHGGHGADQLFGQPLDVCIRDHTKTKEFLTQWEFYYNLNHLSSVMGVPYSQCMLFLTFCKGPLMATWALLTISHDISNRARRPDVTIHNKRLWTYLAESFRWQYTNTQEQE